MHLRYFKEWLQQQQQQQQQQHYHLWISRWFIRFAPCQRVAKVCNFKANSVMFHTLSWLLKNRLMATHVMHLLGHHRPRNVFSENDEKTTNDKMMHPTAAATRTASLHARSSKRRPVDRPAIRPYTYVLEERVLLTPTSPTPPTKLASERRPRP